mgnify:CR=1 FL=1
MLKVVYNTCYGGFGLSDEAYILYAKLKGIDIYPEKGSCDTHFYTSPPTHPHLQGTQEKIMTEKLYTHTTLLGMIRCWFKWLNS